MGFLEDLGKKVADAGQKTVQKTKEMSDVVRLESMATKEENRLNQIYGRIGKLYVELHAEDFTEEFSGMIGEAREATENIRNYRQQIAEVKGARNAVESGNAVSGKCPNCGADIPDDRRFCASCGSPIPQPEAPVAEAEKKFCHNCGAELAADSLFCEKCGKRVS